MIAIIPERVIGMPRNTDRHRPESPDLLQNSDLPKICQKLGKLAASSRPITNEQKPTKRGSGKLYPVQASAIE
jgi:hypothetical protein